MSEAHDRVLPPPQVAAEAYDEEYFLNWCAGYDEWRASDGKAMSPLYPGVIAAARMRPGDVLLDVGTGRGELLAAAVQAGAARAVGVEYSPAAIEMGRRTLAAHGVEDRAEIIEGDARALPLPDETADLATMIDVVEHLTPPELDRTLREVRRVLKPGGRLLVHTTPNPLVYEVTYRLQRLVRPGRRRRWPADPRVELERVMHVNEQTLGSLRRSLRRAGFVNARVRLGEWVHTEMVPEERAKRLYRRLARIPGLRRFGIADIWAEASRPA